MKRNIILHLFQWRLKDIIPQLEMIKKQGFNCIQISVLQPTKEGNEWWKDYQVMRFSIGNKFGSKQDLIELCSRANELGIRVIVDIVPNHVAGADSGELKPHELVDKKIADNKEFFKESKLITNWEDRHQVINYCCGLPSLRLDNHELQDIIIDFLNELIQCGVRGFRVDSAKNIKLPCEGSEFWTRVFDNLDHKEELFNYAEVIFSDRELIEEYAKYINVLTNSYDGVNDKSKIVTFFMSHDTELEFKCTNEMNDEMIIREWEVLLNNNRKSHMLFYSRPYSDLWKSQEIKEINFRY